jgi:hypothetical protein
MGLRVLGRAAALIVAAALASACGGQTGIGSGASQGLPTASRGHRESGSGGDLVYLMTAKGIVILTYPNWSIVATIPGYRRGTLSAPTRITATFLPWPRIKKR